MNEQRNELLRSMALAMGTLRTAVSNVNIGEGVEGCEHPVKVNREIALKQIQRIRADLRKLKPLLIDTD